jgi:hypothetical protein
MVRDAPIVYRRIQWDRKRLNHGGAGYFTGHQPEKGRGKSGEEA